MKVMGLIAFTLAVCLVTASAQPLFLPAGVTAALGAGGLTLTSAAVAANAATGAAAIPATLLASIPIANLVLAKAALVGAGVAKGVILSELLRSRAEREKRETRNNRRH